MPHNGNEGRTIPACYRGRLAPSPTGYLHLGHARTFAIAYQRARIAGGAIALRIDDLDPQRSRHEYLGAAMEDLRWLGFDWDGEPLLQSVQTVPYREAWSHLVAAGWLYPCRCSRRELTLLAGAPHEGAQGDPVDAEPAYPGTCRPAWLPGSADGSEARAQWLAAGPAGHNWRFRVPDRQAVPIHDGSLGLQTFTAGRDFGDFAVWRRDNVPAYQLATVVDDVALGITEVVRGADLLLSAARQALLFRALGQPEPAWFHVPLVTDAAGRRLAKRSDALAIRSLRAAGLTPAQVLEKAASVAPLH